MRIDPTMAPPPVTLMGSRTGTAPRLYEVHKYRSYLMLVWLIIFLVGPVDLGGQSLNVESCALNKHFYFGICFRTWHSC